MTATTIDRHVESSGHNRARGRIDLRDEPHSAHVRSPVDVLRLIVGLATIAGGIAVANLADSALLGLADDSRTALAAAPDWFRELTGLLLASALLAVMAGSMLWALATTRYRRFALLFISVAGAAVLSVAVGHILMAVVDSDVRGAFRTDSPLLRYSYDDGIVHPGDPVIAASVAMLAVGSSYLRASLVRRAAIVLGFYLVVSTFTIHVPALGLLSDIGVGLVVGSLLLLIVGRHDLAPTAEDLRVALARIGIDVEELRHLDVDARGSAPWMGHTADRDQVFVKALGRDERSADLLFRAYRWLKLRRAGDHRPFISLRRSVEHEALVSLQAAALGVPTPKILGVADAGVDGMALAYEGVRGTSADHVGSELTDETLDAIWTMVHQLHLRRIAHRDLRLANIFIDHNNEPLLIDFGFSELAASNQLLGTDVAELLASTAAVVGPTRAVAAAHRSTGLSELERALPWLQPSALSSATRHAIGGAAGLAPIRQTLIEGCGIPEEPIVKLQRIDPKLIFLFATIALSGWFLIPQLADIDNIWDQAKDASIGWALAAVGLSMLTYVAATTALLGALPVRLSFAPAVVAQLASSFANRVTPAKVGGVATNIRYFQHQGVPTSMSITAVGLNAVAGLIAHVLLTIVFLLLSSADEASGLPVPSPTVVATALAIAVVIIAVTTAIPTTRSLLRAHVVPQLRAGWASIRAIGHSPARIGALFGGSGAITLAYLGAMVASLQAFGSTASFPVVGLLFLTGSAVANAAPTPGGLGAAEAALIAALSTAESATIVIPAVFLYRLVTFWLPIVPGWIALNWLRRTQRI